MVSQAASIRTQPVAKMPRAPAPAPARTYAPPPGGRPAYLPAAADRPPGEPVDDLRNAMQQRVAERAVQKAAADLTRLLTGAARERRDERPSRRGEEGPRDGAARPDGQAAEAAASAAPDEGVAAQRTRESPGARARRGSRLESTKDEEPAPDIDTVPEPVTGPAALMRTRLALRSPSAPFDAPASLDIEPERRSDARNEPPTPELQRYRGVFAEAIAAARRLHDALLTEASREAAAAAAAEDARADRRQSDLDADLERLAGGLAESRARLAHLTDTALALLDARAGTARARIARAARQANGALEAAKTKIETRLIQPRTDRLTIIMIAANGQLRVLSDGEAAKAALTSLKDRAEEEFPADDDAMQSAVNEAIATRLPTRAERRAAYYQGEARAELALLQQSFATLPADLDSAFAGVDGLIRNVATAGPAAVARAKDAALKRLNSSVRQMRRTVEAGRAATEAALVRQHDFGRAQLIETAASRAHSEANAAGKRAERDIDTAEALAGGQGKAVRAVIANMERERKRPAAEFARAAVGAGSGLSQRIREMSAEQLPRLARTGQDAREGLGRQSSATARQMRLSADGMALRLDDGAGQSGERIGEQVDQGAAEFVKFADPVSSSIAAYLPPVGAAFDNVFIDLTAALDATFIRVNNALAGTGGGGAGGNTSPAQPAPDPPPDMAPDAFHALVGRIAEDAKTEEKVASLIARSNVDVPNKMASKGDAIYNALSAFSTNVETVMAALRGITARQGAAITHYYSVEHGNIEWDIRRELPKTFSTGYTNRKNVEAAINYLHGNNAEAALAEMQAAVHLWNDEARVEAVQRSLTPEQMQELIDLDVKTGGAVTEVRNDLDGVDQQVFDALETQDIGKANALRLRAGIDTDREKRGDEGADAAVDRLAAAAQASSDDPIEGADPLGLDEPEERRALETLRWQQTQEAFAELEPVPPGEQAAFEGPGAALYRYATSERNYRVFVPHEYPRGAHDHMGGHYETRREGVSRNQERLMQMIIQHGPDSDQTAAARLMVEMHRSGGKPKLDRLDMATRDTLYEAHEGETLEQREETRKAVEAREGKRRDRVFMLYDQYKMEGGQGPPRSPDVVREEISAQVGAQFAGDPTAAAYARAMVDSPNPADQAQAAFEYALAHEDKSKETLQRTFGRMNRDEVRTAVAEYDANRGSGPSLYTRLGIRGQRKHWLLRRPDEEPLLSGDEANEIEVASLGVPRNDKERADVALLTTQQQVRDSGWLGRLLARKEYDRLLRAQKRLEQAAGMKLGEEAFDERGELRMVDPATGQLSPIGHFDETGRFKPPAGTDAYALEKAMHLATLSAEGYRQATDRIATALTTSLMIIAAVVTTALTGGAAASIWIPVLVTAGAGLVGIGLTAAIKGDRYTRAELERDLVVTLVQAATAGLGAAAGVALRGGMPALRAVSSRMVLSEKVLERFMQVGGRGGLRQSLTLGEEALIAGGSNMLNSATAAAMDPQARRSGKSFEEAFNAGWRGFVGGSLGSAAMRPVMRAGIKQPAAGRPPPPPPSLGGQIVRRAFGSAASGTTTRATEIAWEDQRGHRMSSQEVVDELGFAFFQNLAQGAVEARAEQGSDRFRARRAATRRAAAAARAAAAQPPARPAAPATAEAPAVPTVRPAAPAPGEAPPVSAVRPAAPATAEAPAVPTVRPAAPAPGEAPPVPAGRSAADAEAAAHTQQIREAVPPALRESAAQAMESAAPRPPPAPSEPTRPSPRAAAEQPPVTPTAEGSTVRAPDREAPAARRPRVPAPRTSGGSRDGDEGPSRRGPRPSVDEEAGEPGARPGAEGEEVTRPQATLPEAEQAPTRIRAEEPIGEDDPTLREVPEGDAQSTEMVLVPADEGATTQTRLRIPTPPTPLWRRAAAWTRGLGASTAAWMRRAVFARMANSKLLPKRLREFAKRFIPQGDLPDMSVVMDRDHPHDEQVATDMYWRMIRDSPNREAAIYRNTLTGDYVVVQGDEGATTVQLTATGMGEGPTPGGTYQRWKELLDRGDIGSWEVQAHFHPPDERGRTGMANRLPSGGDGDFGALMAESREARGTPRASRIDFIHNGVRNHTEFGFDPTSTTARYWVDFHNPVTDQRGRREFPNLQAYARYFREMTGRDLSPTPTMPPVPGGGRAPRRPSGPPDVRGAAAAVPGTMFVGRAPKARQSPSDVATQAAEAMKRATTKESAAETGFQLKGPRGSDGSYSLTLRHPVTKKKTTVRIIVEPTDPAKMVPADNSDVPPADYQRDPSGLKIKDADVVYRIRVSLETDPLNVAPALGHELREIHRVETRRLAGETINPETQTHALARGSKAAELSVHDRGQLDQLHVRMRQIDEAGRAIAALESADPAHPGLPARRADLARLRDDAKLLVAHLGMGDDPDAAGRFSLVMADPDVPPAVREALSLAVDASLRDQSAGMPGVFVEDPVLARVAAGDRTVTRAEYEAAQRRQRAQQHAFADLDVPEIIAPHDAPRGPPRKPTDAELEAARTAASDRRKEIDQETLDHFRARNTPERNAELDRLLKLDPDGVMEVIRADNPTREKRMLAALVRRLYAQQMGHDEVRANFLALRNLLGGDTGLRVSARRAEALEAYKGGFAAADAAFQDHLANSPKAAATRAKLAGRAKQRAALRDMLQEFLRDEPALRTLAGSNPELVGWRFGRYIDETPPRQRNADHFLKKYGEYEESNLRPAVGEPEGTRLLAKKLGMMVLQGGPAGSRYSGAGGHRANDEGIDIVGFRPVTDPPTGPGAPAKRRVEVILGDDKSLRDKTSLSSVTALTENMTHNLSDQATLQRSALEAQRRAGLEISPDHEAAVKQIEQAAQALQALDKKWAGGSKANYRDPKYQAKVRAILDAANIRLVITSTYGDIAKVDPVFAGYKFEVIQ